MKHSKNYLQRKHLGEANFVLLEEVKQLISEECDNSEQFLVGNGFGVGI